MKYCAKAAFVLVLASASALAGNDSGLYVGAGVGRYNVEIENVSAGTFKGDDTTLKVFAGWRLNPYLGFELDYIDLGETSDSIANIDFKSKINGYAPYVIGTLPVGPVELFGKVGYYFYDVDFSGSGTNAKVSDSGEDLAYGVGVGLTLLEHIHVRLEYEIIDVKNTKDSNAVWLSGAWRF